MGPDEAAVVYIDVEPDDGPPFGIVTTQSCDVDEEGRDTKPWVQVAPVYELPEHDDRLGQVRRWRVSHMAPVPALGPQWVADVRIEVPVEKSWLVLQEVQSAFRTPEEFDDFSDFCRNYKGRQGLATAIYDHIITSLEQLVMALRQADVDAFQEFIHRVDHLYLDINGDRLAPTAVQVVFVGEHGIPPRLCERLDGWWEQAHANDKKGFVLLPNRYLMFDQVRFAEWRHWMEQALDRLAGSS